MARSHARILTSIWTDADFTALGTDAQWLYVVILSQGNLSFVGVTALTPRRWAGYSRNMTTARITRALAELVAADFVFYDVESEEVMVRSFMKHDGVLTSPNVLKAAARDLPKVISPTLRDRILAAVPPDRRAAFELPPEQLPEPLREGFDEEMGDPTPEGSRARARDSPSPSPAPAASPPVSRSANGDAVGSVFDRAIELLLLRMHKPETAATKLKPAEWLASARRGLKDDHRERAEILLGLDPALTAEGLADALVPPAPAAPTPPYHRPYVPDREREPEP